MLRGEDDFSQDRLVLDDPDIAFDVESLRQPVVERDQVGQPVAGFELMARHQLVGQRDTVDRFAALMDFRHAGENAPVLFEAEVVGLQRAGCLDEVGIVHQD